MVFFFPSLAEAVVPRFTLIGLVVALAKVSHENKTHLSTLSSA